MCECGLVCSSTQLSTEVMQLWTIDVTIAGETEDGMIGETQANLVAGAFVMLEHMLLLITRTTDLIEGGKEMFRARFVCITHVFTVLF